MTLSHPKQKNPDTPPSPLQNKKEQTDWSALWLRKYQNFDIIFQWVQILELWVRFFNRFCTCFSLINWNLSLQLEGKKMIYKVRIITQRAKRAPKR